MAGLLDQFFGSPDQTQALGLLGIGLMRGDFGAGAGAAMQHMAGAKERERQAQMDAVRMQLMQAQVGNYQSEAEARKAKTAQEQQRLTTIRGLLGNLDAGVPKANDAVIGQTGNLAPTNANASLHTQAFQQATNNNPLSRIPRSAIDWELATGDGKQIGNWLFDMNKPNIEFINGVAVDKNRTQPGSSIPQMSPTGQGYQILPDPSAPGGYRVVPPAGATDLYRQFKTIDSEISSGNELVTVDLPEGPRQMTKAQALRYVGGGHSSPSLPQIGGGQPLTPRLRDAIARDARANGITNPDTTFTGIGPGQMGDLHTGAPAASTAPGVPLRAKPTEGQKALDEAFGKEYATWTATGGYTDVVKQIAQLEDVAQALKTDSSLTGPMVGLQPDSVLAVTNPAALAAKNQAEEVIQRNLRTILGAQFTEKEGDRLISRAFNPSLKPAENLLRINRLITQIRSAAETKADAARYFEQHGTLAGWKGKLPSFADFNPDNGRKSSGKVSEERPKPTFEELPPASAYKGKQATDQTTGKRYISNGFQWVEQKE